MCGRCDNEQNDPRKRAFITYGMMKSLTKKEIERYEAGKVRGDFENPIKNPKPYADVTIFADPGLAKFQSFKMLKDPSIHGLDIEEYEIGLN